MATTLESRTVKDHFADICDSIPASGVSTLADELLQADLICVASHRAAIEASTGLPSDNKISNMVSEVMTKVAGSQDKFAKFVSILERRNKELAREILKSSYPGLASSDEEIEMDRSPAPKRRKKHDSHDSLADEYVAQLQQVYKAPPPTWNPLPQCKHIKLAMVKEKGKQYVGADEKITASRVEGKVAKILEVKVSIDMDAIFDNGIFDKKGCQVILVEGGPGMGKTSLAYYYCQRWADGKLNVFDAVALVRLHDFLCIAGNGDDAKLCKHSSDGTCILPHLLLLACKKKIEVSKETAHFLVNKKKLLLVLDGWDELPGEIDQSKFFDDLLASVSPPTVILITSRPESSLLLHDQVNRVSIIGFTEENVEEYFRNTFQSELSPKHVVTAACEKLSDHFSRYPVVKSCCYVPLNAAILAYVYLSGGNTLPITRFELFRGLVLCCIKRELETHMHEPIRVPNDVSSFEDLPPVLSKQLHNLCVLAFEGVKNNKIVFSQKELTSFQLPKDLPTLGLLESVEGYGSVGSRQIAYNFIHLAVQELLAAYYISKMESDKHAEVFESLLNESRSSAVLQFYSAFSQLNNEGVRNFITKQGICSLREGDQKYITLSYARVSILNCFFEAQLHDESFFRQFLDNPVIQHDNFFITLSPLDCLSLFYFLSSTRAVTRGNVRVDLSNCHIDSHSQAVLLGEFPEHGKSSTTRVLDCVTEWTMRDITDTGLACIGTALTTNNTLKVLTLRHKLFNLEATDDGLAPFQEALQNNQSLESLSIDWLSTHPDQSLTKMWESVTKSLLKQLNMRIVSPWLQAEEIKDWAQSVQAGATNLIQSLESHQLQHFMFDRRIYSHDGRVTNQVVDSLHAQVKSIWQAEGFLSITLADDQHYIRTPFRIFL